MSDWAIPKTPAVTLAGNYIKSCPRSPKKGDEMIKSDNLLTESELEVIKEHIDILVEAFRVSLRRDYMRKILNESSYKFLGQAS